MHISADTARILGWELIFVYTKFMPTPVISCSEGIQKRHTLFKIGAKFNVKPRED